MLAAQHCAYLIEQTRSIGIHRERIRGILYEGAHASDADRNRRTHVRLLHRTVPKHGYGSAYAVAMRRYRRTLIWCWRYTTPRSLLDLVGRTTRSVILSSSVKNC